MENLANCAIETFGLLKLFLRLVNVFRNDNRFITRLNYHHLLTHRNLCRCLRSDCSFVDVRSDDSINNRLYSFIGEKISGLFVYRPYDCLKAAIF